MQRNTQERTCTKFVPVMFSALNTTDNNCSSNSLIGFHVGHVCSDIGKQNMVHAHLFKRESSLFIFTQNRSKLRVAKFTQVLWRFIGSKIWPSDSYKFPAYHLSSSSCSFLLFHLLFLCVSPSSLPVSLSLGTMWSRKASRDVYNVCTVVLLML